MRRFAILSLVLVAGCGTTVLNRGKEENDIRSNITKLGTAVQSVKCPSGVKVGKGIVTYCTATLQTGETVSIKATQTNNNGLVDLRTTTMIAGVVENTIEARLRPLGISATATCPRHVPITVGSRFSCTLRDNAGHTGHVHVTIENSIGAFKLGAPR